MLIEKIARRPMTIGTVVLVPGDVVPDSVSALLPPGRLKTLTENGWIQERPAGPSDVSELVARIALLESRIDALEARRGPGRPRKVADDGI